jgi:hypothetical protein
VLRDIGARRPARTLGDVERLGLRGAAQLVGDVGVPLGGKFGDDLERKREELDRLAGQVP